VGMDFRPGDWLCTCGAHNYASKTACFKCRMPREVAAPLSLQPQVQQQQPDYQSTTFNSFGGGMQGGLAGMGVAMGGGMGGIGGIQGMGGGLGPAFGGTTYDPSSYYNPIRNFGDGYDNTYRDPSQLSGTASIAGLPPFPNSSPPPTLPVNFRPGDWLCTCGNHNYAIRSACGKCGKIGKVGAGPNLPANFRPGDWMCNCGNHNYQSRTVCGKCQEAKETAKKPVMTVPNFQVGDWMCICGAHNYQSKTVCFKCSMAKESALAEQPAQATSFRAGDWLCTSCQNHNYASRIVCGRCKAPKPAPAGDHSPTASGARERSRSPR